MGLKVSQRGSANKFCAWQRAEIKATGETRRCNYLNYLPEIGELARGCFYGRECKCEWRYDNRIQPDPGGRGTICLLWPGRGVKYSGALLIWPTAERWAMGFWGSWAFQGRKGRGFSHDL